MKSRILRLTADGGECAAFWRVRLDPCRRAEEAPPDVSDPVEVGLRPDHGIGRTLGDLLVLEGAYGPNLRFVPRPHLLRLGAVSRSTPGLARDLSVINARRRSRALFGRYLMEQPVQPRNELVNPVGKGFRGSTHPNE